MIIIHWCTQITVFILLLPSGLCPISRVWWVNYCHLELLILCIHLICYRFCQVLSTVYWAVRHCLWEKQHIDTIHPSRNLEMASWIAWHSHWKLQYKNFSVFECQFENNSYGLKRLRCPMRIIKVQQLRSIARIIPMRKELPNFSKSIRSIAKDIVPEFLIRQVVHEDIREEISCSKTFEQIQASRPTEHTLIFLR